MCGKLIYLVSLVLVLGLVSNAGGEIASASALVSEDFETGDFGKFPWQHYGDTNWAVTSWQEHSGAYSAQAGAIEDDESTTLQVRLDCVPGNITFHCKVSSELDYDYLKFYIDGVEKGSWSGDEDWTEVSFPVTEGTRTFEWTYSKDGSMAEGDDTAWIDDIVFPVEGYIEPAEIPFKRGVNLTGWFQYISSVRQIQFTKFTKQDLSLIHISEPTRPY